MGKLFDSVRIKNMEIKNRFVRSATYDGLAVQECVSDAQVRFFTDLADGGVGLIVSGITHVHPNGQSSPMANSIAADKFVQGLKKLTDAVHDHGAKFAIQLFHGGREARFVKTRNELPLAPSVIEDDPFYKGKYRELTDNEIWEIINAFGDGALRAREAGFDAVQVHGAHAYLLSQFLSPFTNRREDHWGGSLQNRLRFHSEIYKDIRKKVGEDYPVFIKLGVEDGFSGGLEFNEGKQGAKILADLGFDAVEISQGLRGERYSGTEFKTKINSIVKEAYYRDWCGEIKNVLDVPLIMVGGLRTFSLMEEIVAKNEAELISLSRPLICEPDIINVWKVDSQKKPRCISCNKCIEGVFKGQKLTCAIAQAK